MNWLKKTAAPTRQFVGTCANCLADEWFSNNIASDATQLAQLVVENFSPLTMDQFLQLCDVDSELATQIKTQPAIFTFAQSGPLTWAYNEETDIHYFFAEI